MRTCGSSMGKAEAYIGSVQYVPGLYMKVREHNEEIHAERTIYLNAAQ